MAGKIFINYRRGDDAGFTQALYQRLEDEFTAADLFMDVEGHIKPGDDFVDVLNAQVALADVLLVVIGPRWGELLSARAADPDDFVAIEIKAALDRGTRVIPVLVGGAGVPRADTLPEEIRALARRNAVGLRPDRFRADCQGLVTSLREHLAAAEKERTTRSEAERKVAEAKRLQQEADDAARIVKAEAQAQARKVAGLSPEEIRKAEELANWDFIKERGQPETLRDHLARFPGGVTALYASTKLEELVWAGIGSAAGIGVLQAFLDEFPNGNNVSKAQARIVALQKEAAEVKTNAERHRRETEAWAAIAGSTDKVAIEKFLYEWPHGQHASAARARIVELRGQNTLVFSIIAISWLIVGIVLEFAMGVLFEFLRWSFLSISTNTQSALSGFLTGMIIVVCSAPFLVWPRRRTINRLELAIYALGLFNSICMFGYPLLVASHTRNLPMAEDVVRFSTFIFVLNAIVLLLVFWIWWPRQRRGQ